MKQFSYGHKKGDYWCDGLKKFSFFGIPKNCSTSVRNSFGNYSCYNINTTPLNSETVSFSIFRDPFHRCISGYFEILKKRPDSILKKFDKPFFRMKESSLRFESYLKDIKENGFYDSHCSPQIYFITKDSGEVYDLDYIFTMDSISNKLKEKLGITIGFHNKSKSVNRENYLNEVNVELIKDIYKQDLFFYESIKDKEYNKL